MEAQKLKAMYTVPELAKMCNEDRFKLFRTLKKMGLLSQPGGPRTTCIVFMADIRSQAPKLWSSILDKRMLDQLF